MEVELYVLKAGGRAERLHMSYEEYIWPAILWATKDAKNLAEVLDVVKVVVQGDHLIGLFGGEKKSGMERYAGLVVTNLKPVPGGFYIRLYNTDREYMVPAELMRKRGIDIFKVYYGGSINPFKCSTLDVILSSIGEEELKKFIWELIRINEGAMTEADERRLRRLAEEVRAQVKVLNGSHYVMYRGNRVFTACVPEDLNKAVAEHHAPHMECRSAEQAHYYAAVLNYMAYMTIRKGREFLRQQYSRLPLAIAAADLSWKDLPPQLRGKIAVLSHTLSKKLTWRDYPNQKEALLETARTPEFAQIIKLLDKHIESTGKQERLEEALNLVAARKPPVRGAAGGI